jgi:hypothetical protein
MSRKADLTSPAPAGAAGFDWQDPLALEGELTEDERMVQATARGWPPPHFSQSCTAGCFCVA